MSDHRIPLAKFLADNLRPTVPIWVLYEPEPEERRMTSSDGDVWQVTFRECHECRGLVEDRRYLEHTAWHAETHRPVEERLLDAWSEGYGEGYADGVAGHRTD